MTYQVLRDILEYMVTAGLVEKLMVDGETHWKLTPDYETRLAEFGLRDGYLH